MRNWVRVLAVGGALLALPAAQADKLYKWTDADGNLHYTDHPPTPAEAKSQERKKFGDKPTDVALPYALQQALKKFPVTLYTADCGDACIKAAALLSTRGVPYTEKNAREAVAAEELKALNGGKLEVPLLKLGNQIVKGYEEAGWNRALDAAGYPSSPVVPKAVAAKAAAGKSGPPRDEPHKSSEPEKETKPLPIEDKPSERKSNSAQ
jgi:hypothetical protein